MADNIILEPSCDLHLVLDFGVPKRNLEFHVWARTWRPNECEYKLEDVTWECDYLLYPNNVSIVDVDELNNVLKPQAKGTAFMLVRYNDNPFNPANGTNHYLVARIQVHQHLNNWWFGNNRISVNRLDRFETQVSLYAHFDNDPLGMATGIIGDITGHGYVELTESDKAVFVVENRSGRLLGLTTGTAQLQGHLQGRTHSLDIMVRKEIVTEQLGDKCHPEPILKPLLKRIVYNGPPAEKYNILFLTEGFTADALTSEDAQSPAELFEKILHDLTYRLFVAHRHSPFRLLKDSFNVWYAFVGSEEGGITVCPEIAQEVDNSGLSSLLPMPYHSKDKSQNYYSLGELVRTVGLPSEADLSRFQRDNLLKSMAEQIKHWENLGLVDFDPKKVVQDVYFEWLKQIPRGLIQVHDSFFGFRYGRRWGDRDSGKDNGGTLSAQDLQQRVYEWFEPQLPVRGLSVDPRRYSIRHKEFIHLLRFINTLADPLAASDDLVNFHVGQYWQPDWKPDRSKGQVNSSGLICIWVNDYLQGGTYNHEGRMAIQTVKAKKKVRMTSNGLILSRDFDWVGPEINRMLDVLSHELGHAFNLGDEYEEYGTTDPAKSDFYDNLTHINIIRDNSVVNPDPSTPIPVDYFNVKWYNLHRISQSDVIVRDAEMVGFGKWKLTLDGDRIQRWLQALANNILVYLRKWKGHDGVGTQQLPFHLDELAGELQITEIAKDGSNTLVVQGLVLRNLTVFPTGSLLYIPKKDKDGNPLFLVEKTIRDFIATSKQPLSHNHTGSQCDPPNNLPDMPFLFLQQVSTQKGTCNLSQESRIIGLYEGGNSYSCGVYRPAGICKMRSSQERDPREDEIAKNYPEETHFCFVCQYLIVNQIDPGQHEALDKIYHNCL